MKDIVKQESKELTKQLDDLFKQGLDKEIEYRGKKKTVYEHCIDRLYKIAMDGDKHALFYLFDRVLGKPINSNVSIDGDKVIVNIIKK